MARLYLAGGVLAIIAALALWGFVMMKERDAARADASTYKVIASINQKSFEHLSEFAAEQNKKVAELGEAKIRADVAREHAEGDVRKLIEANERVRAWLKTVPTPASTDECHAVQAKIVLYREKKGLQ